ncbi:MAG: site-specific integrase [Bdellovibrionales bacterium]|nr:site-specific integrase [Bdellovibrionales bacterium]
MDDVSRHYLMDDKVQLYMRANSPHWQCACSVAGRQRRTTTHEESLSRAKDVARDWYLGLMGKYRAGELKEGKTFREASQRFIDEFEVITQGQRSPIYVKGHKDRIKNHLNPFFGDKVLSEITPGMVQDYRIHRMKTGKARSVQLSANGEEQRKPPARSTLHQEIVCLRQILKTAQRHGWLPFLPDISPPYKSSGKISHRAWFSPDEYKQLYKATRERAQKPKKERWRTASENLHDYVLIMVNTGLRPDEALRLEFRDVAIVTDEATGERILEIEVRGKRGVGFCKSMPGAVIPFERLKKRNNGKPTERLFPKFQRELFNTLLDELDLKTDRDGQSRTAYSLRHTYICMRLMEGADIYQIAKNCRTSVEMIETYYASHIKNTLDAAAINVMKPRKKSKKPSKRLKKDVEDED